MFASIRKNFREQTSGIALPLIAAGVGINLLMGEVTALAKVPLYLDSVGTVLIAVSCGAYAGMVCGVAANLIAGILFSPPMIFFAPVSAAIGLFAGWAGDRNGFSSVWKSAAFGVAQGIITAVLSAPISAFVFGGVTLGGTDFLVLYFRATGENILNSVLYQGLASDPIDKCITFVIVFLLLQRLPSTLRTRLPRFAKN